MLETELINGCKKYNPAAQKAVYKTYYSIFIGISLRYTGDKEEAKDIVQEAFLKIFTNIEKYREEGSFEGWMKRIVINDTITYIKKKAKNRPSSLSDYELDLLDKTQHPFNIGEESQTNTVFSEEELLEAIHSLPEELRIVFNLICIEEYSHKEVASFLRISEENSRARLMKARQKLKKILEAKTVKF
jgi:RNA polymerase sigma-70 factor, ECF subfamily